MQNYLRRIRKGKGITLADLSRATGLSIGTIGNFETGERGIGSESLEKIAQSLGIGVAEILRDPAESNCVREDNGLYMVDSIKDLKTRIAELENELVQARAVIRDMAAAMAAMGRAAGAAPASGALYKIRRSKSA